MPKYESFKFIVIPTKYIETMSGKNRQRLRWALQDIKKQRKKLSKEPDPRYYVCNQNEPYAGDIINIILRGEADKIAEKTLICSACRQPHDIGTMCPPHEMRFYG